MIDSMIVRGIGAGDAGKLNRSGIKVYHSQQPAANKTGVVRFIVPFGIHSQGLLQWPWWYPRIGAL
jgi:hypothetical protein